MSSFYDRYSTERRRKGSVLCVGLDPDPARLPEGYDRGDIIPAIRSFLADVIRATGELAVAYKPNLAFFEVLGPRGMELFADVLEEVRSLAPEALIIADAKRGDVGHTAERYAKTFFETYQCDAVTLRPYMGMDTIDPFLAYRERAAIVLCHTSNAGAPEFQESGEPPLYLRMAAAVATRNEETGNLWMVVGATRDPASIRRIRDEAPDVPLLVPGVGAQGGDLEGVLEAAGQDVLIYAGRAILYAAPERDGVARAAAAEAERLVRVMRTYLS